MDSIIDTHRFWTKSQNPVKIFSQSKELFEEIRVFVSGSRQPLGRSHSTSTHRRHSRSKFDGQTNNGLVDTAERLSASHRHSFGQPTTRQTKQVPPQSSEYDSKYGRVQQLEMVHRIHLHD